MGEEAVCLGRSGMDVLKAGEEETRRGGVESSEPIQCSRQYLEKERWERYAQD